VANFDGQAFFTRLLVALNERDVEALREMVDPEVVGTSPQSGERSAGFDAFLREGDAYPGGTPEVEVHNSRLIGEDERWAITPSYTVIPMASPKSYTAVMKVRYPDGTNWLVVLLVELRDEKVASVETYYAPELPAPLAGSIAAYQHG
jgi:hypothetical protein